MKPVDKLREAREHLLEARRYAARDPKTSRREAGLALAAIGWAESLKAIPWNLAERLSVNLTTALASISVDPEVFQGYAWGASFELAGVIARMIHEEAPDESAPC